MDGPNVYWLLTLDNPAVVSYLQIWAPLNFFAFSVSPLNYSKTLPRNTIFFLIVYLKAAKIEVF